MEIFFILIGFVLIVILPIATFAGISGVKRKLEEIQQDLTILKTQVMMGSLPPGREREKPVQEAAPTVPEPEEPVPGSSEGPSVKILSEPPPIPEIVVAAPPEPVSVVEEPPAEPVPSDPVRNVGRGGPVLEPVPEESWLERFFRGIGDWLLVRGRFAPEGMAWEYAMATNWLLRLGIVTVLGGMVFFLKWSIDHGLLSPAGRVGLTLLAAAGLIFWGMRMLFKKYHLLAQGMCATGFILFYFGFFAAYSMYHLIASPTAFALWVCVSVGAGIFAVRYRSLFIACLGLIGGYLTPVLLGKDTGNAWGFYGYLLILTGAGVTVALLRRWRSLTLLAMVFCYGLAFAYAGRHTSQLVLMPGMVFFSLTHLLFLGATLWGIHAAQREGRRALWHYGVIGVNAVVYALWVLGDVRSVIGMEKTGIIFLGVVACYVAVSQIGLRKGVIDALGVKVLISTALGFLTLVPVLLFNLSWLTFSWCVLAVILARLGREESLSILKGWSLFFLTIAALHTVSYNCYELYWHTEPWTLGTAGFLKAFILRILKMGILPATFLWLVRDQALAETRTILKALALIGCFIATTAETAIFGKMFMPSFVSGLITIAWTLFAIGLIAGGIKRNVPGVRRAGLILFGVVVAKLFLIDLSGLATIYRVTASLLVGILLVCASALYLKNQAKFKVEEEK
ncbi:MAG: DUF2339 domain-containing protein [Kiritimatiellae bacterium]|nr:DUF2339 domain-containing protein [Kiritimatiellia bacterium]